MTAPFSDPPRSVGQRAAPFIIAAIGATVALILTILVVPGWAIPALRWYLVVAGTIAVVAAIRAIMVRYPVHRRSPFEPVVGSPAPAELPARLRDIDRLVADAGWDAADFQARLRPILRAIAAQRLARYRSIDMEAEPEAARAALGDSVWTLLAPSPRPPDRRDNGIALGDLRAAVETLEALHAAPHD